MHLGSPAAGTYTTVVGGFDVPSGSIAYDYENVFLSSALGAVTVDSAPVKVGTGATTSGAATAAAPAPEGREFFGQVQMVNARGTLAGTARVQIGKVTQ